jgi:hypothetical protein
MSAGKGLYNNASNRGANMVRECCKERKLVAKFPSHPAISTRPVLPFPKEALEAYIKATDIKTLVMYVDESPSRSQT